MNGFGRVKKECRGARARQRRRDLAADEPGLSHARHDDASLALAEQLHGAVESIVETIDEGQDGGGLGFEDLPRQRPIGPSPTEQCEELVLLPFPRRDFGNKPVWLTEYGYQTNPPDRVYGVSLKNQATYMQQAWNKVAANPRVDVFIWFLLTDEQRIDQGWQSGLYTVAGKAKPSRAVFKRLTR
jgi:hypothetical protein